MQAEIILRFCKRPARPVWLSAVLLICILPVSAQQGGNAEMAAVKVHQVGAGGASTIFSFYNTTPESPDGSTIAYVRCIDEPSGDGDDKRAPAELWVCDRDLKQHRKVAEIAGTAAHNGVEAQWIDNDRIALFDSGSVRLISVLTGKDLLKRKIKADGMGHNPFANKILYNIYTNDGRGEPGIYELDCNTQQVSLVLRVRDCAKARFPDYLKKEDFKPVAEWRALHTQYSPDGKKIAFRLDAGNSTHAKLLGICNIDGTGLKVMTKSLHFFWYDNKSIVGHLQVDSTGNRPDPFEKRFSLTRWDTSGKIVQEMMAPRGNHLAMSPDRKLVASESFYQTNPVVLKLYETGHPETGVTITSFDPYGVTWKRRFHANPAFSRDGKRIYFSRPLNEKYNGTFYCEIE